MTPARPQDLEHLPSLAYALPLVAAAPVRQAAPEARLAPSPPS
ncbi:hypothetical protein [Streptomyces iranensis]|uniref:Uncharacterized protein n=1 Tax=Streptomyces iranensis TaxID=576784 RepID=A0ABS4MRS0_9ACTN|nr:hypothetical protein [Streptomyces iranensis]